MRGYRVGSSLRDLRERVHTVGRSHIHLNDHQDSEVSVHANLQEGLWILFRKYRYAEYIFMVIECVMFKSETINSGLLIRKYFWYFRIWYLVSFRYRYLAGDNGSGSLWIRI